MTLSVTNREITEMYGSIMNDFVDAGFVHFVTGTLTLMTKNEIGRLAVINDEVVENVNEVVRRTRPFTIFEISEYFSRIRRSNLYEVVTQRLQYYKFSARYVPEFVRNPE